jgi:hypothetical protein
LGGLQPAQLATAQKTLTKRHRRFAVSKICTWRYLEVKMGQSHDNQSGNAYDTTREHQFYKCETLVFVLFVHVRFILSLFSEKEIPFD